MPPMKDFELNELRKSAASKGERLWRSLQEFPGSDAFRNFGVPELPGSWTDSMDRRQMLRLIGASLALAGFTACSSPPPEKIVPYVHEPEGLVPGRPLFYASAMPLSGYGKGVLVESHLGRPTKIEGNPKHPASLGATDIFGQASILSLYDPDRSQSVMFEGRLSSWTAFSSALNSRLEEQQLKKGAGLRILTEAVTSPTLLWQMQEIQKRFPESRWYQYEPGTSDGARAGSRIAFGQNVNTYFRPADADLIVALDSDFLTQGPAWLRYSREWATRRQRDSGPKGMNRMYAIESTPTCTGVVADHRLSVRSRDIEGFGRALARAIGLNTPGAPAGGPEIDAKFVETVARDLLQHRGSSLVIPGEYQPGTLHALAHIMNQFLGNAGKTVIYTDPIELNAADPMQSIRELTEEMKKGRVDLLLILSGNPAFTAPADLGFADAMRQVPFNAHLGLHFDETGARCPWHVPETHYLESWGDVRAFDGTASIIQPSIAPLYDAHTAQEILAIVQGDPNLSSREIVRNYWQTQHPSPDFEDFWLSSLQSGVVPNTALPPKTVAANQNAVPEGHTRGSAQEMEIIFRPDPSIFDGRFANNGWLQELPKPLTKVTWDNTALIGPATAERLGFSLDELREIRGKGIPGPIVELRYRNRSVQAPVYLLPGHPENSVTVHYGYGRIRAGKVGNRHGFNGYALRGSDAPEFDTGVEMRRTGENGLLATTQHHFTMAGRDLVRTVTQDEYRKNPEASHAGKESPSADETLYRAHDWPYLQYKWAMTVNLSKCVGCNACVVACEAENNTPILGKEQVGREREMQWLRIDRYYTGPPERPETHFEPVFCMHCELAPCELVCPVHATNHSSEGINQMVYNRCVGTRFCSHNCPYKVRRFNFLQFSDYITPSKEPMYNPDVTVRSRGVMEKCTYCIQRIQEAKITASKENRKVKDGEIMTACQQACPTQVFTFGDLNDRDSAVSRSANDPLNYGLLTELNTRPRTTYLAAMTNPQPDLEKREGK